MDQLVESWVRGWAVSRGVSGIRDVGEGWRIEVGLPRHRVRYVLRGEHDGLLGELGRGPAVPGTVVKMLGTPAGLRAALPAEWTMLAENYLMTAPLVAGMRPVPAGYTLRVDEEGPLIVATVASESGQAAAWARLGIDGSFGAVDQVETDPDHRRRGLGTVVMTALGNHAVRRGVHVGVLVATVEGRGLYESLGWTTRGPFAGAYVPEG